MAQWHSSALCDSSQATKPVKFGNMCLYAKTVNSQNKREDMSKHQPSNLEKEDKTRSKNGLYKAFIFLHFSWFLML